MTILAAGGRPRQPVTSEYPAAMVRLKCWKCDRSGQYRKAKLRYYSDEHDGDLGTDLADLLVGDFERLVREG